VYGGEDKVTHRPRTVVRQLVRKLVRWRKPCSELIGLG
jgi:uncharacterized protein YjiS (DUF1127 family)